MTILDKVKTFFGINTLSEEEKNELEEARRIIPRFNKNTGEEYEWYYYFKETPVPPYDEKTGKASEYGKRKLVVEHNIGSSGNPTFWSKEKGVYQNPIFITKGTFIYYGPGKRL